MTGIRLTAAAAALITVTGCSHYVTNFVPPTENVCTAATAQSFETANACINKLKETYRVAAGDYINQQQVSDLGVIAAGGVAVAAALFGGHADYYKAAGLGAGGLLALRNYYSGTDRAAILFDGIGALRCLESLSLEGQNVGPSDDESKLAAGYIWKGISDTQSRVHQRSLGKQTTQQLSDTIALFTQQATTAAGAAVKKTADGNVDLVAKYMKEIAQRSTECLTKAG